MMFPGLPPSSSFSSWAGSQFGLRLPLSVRCPQAILSPGDLARGCPPEPPMHSDYLCCWDSAILGRSPLESGKLPGLEADPLKETTSPPSNLSLEFQTLRSGSEGTQCLLHPQFSLPLGRLLTERPPIPLAQGAPRCPIPPPRDPSVTLGLLGYPCSCSPSSLSIYKPCPGFSSASLTALCLFLVFFFLPIWVVTPFEPHVSLLSGLLWEGAVLTST